MDFENGFFKRIKSNKPLIYYQATSKDIIESELFKCLKIAEKKGQELILEARQRRSTAKKHAFHEATLEIDSCWDLINKNLEKLKIKSNLEDQVNNPDDICAEDKIEELSFKYSQNKDSLVKKIVDLVLNVQPTLTDQFEYLNLNFINDPFLKN